jgi:hypothetical protein
METIEKREGKTIEIKKLSKLVKLIQLYIYFTDYFVCQVLNKI